MDIAVDVSILEVVSESASVIETQDSGFVITETSSDSITVANESVNLIEVGIQGPPGAGGSWGQTFDQRTDLNSSQTVVYRAVAAVGSNDIDPVWQIARVAISYGDVITTITTYPNSDNGFHYSWTNRTNYTYG